MAHEYDATEVKGVDGDYSFPDGEYPLIITAVKEGLSKEAKDFQVIVDYEVVEGPQKGQKVRFHYVTFFPPAHKAAGISVHYLKSIGQPWQGKFRIDPDAWVGKTLSAYLAAEEYNGKKSMKVKWVKPSVETDSQVGEESIETVPF